jgi:hypothetical protein
VLQATIICIRHVAVFAKQKYNPERVFTIPMTSSLASKQWLQRQFQSSGIKVDSAALTELASFVENIDEPEQFLDAVLDEIERGELIC